ncbi:MAG: aminomethyl transferase family protein, partial [Proteobacteria bacterium]|nr:aminomethyl transferase family protein [Pseudomonadota bacterium]
AVLPLSHQDIGDWPFAENPWLFALPIGDETSAFTKDFIGGEALRQLKNPEFTYPFAGFDPRKVLPGDKTVVTDENDRVIGRVLTCVTDMAIGRHGDRIVGLASSDRPEDMKFRGLGCGFVKTDQRLESGRIVFLKDSGRRIKVEIVTDIRPARTARLALKKML